MSDWLTVEFQAQLPDGMKVYDLDQAATSEALALLFGFSRVRDVVITQTTEDGPSVRTLIDDDTRPRQRFGGPDHAMHPSRDRS
jgi:hypothetical protein